MMSAGVFTRCGVAVLVRSAVVGLAWATAAQSQVTSMQMAFVANTGGRHWDIVVVDPDNPSRNPITQTAYDESDPRWSPDRKKIVFSASDNRLYVVEVETGKVEEVAAEDASPQKTGPCFSPDGTKIVYSRLNGKTPDDTDLAILDLKTKTSRPLIQQYGPQFDPDWSSDARTIVYVSTHCSADCGRIIQELWLVSSQGGYGRQLLMTNSHCVRPRWSPDGKRIAFASDKGGNFDIWVLSLDDWGLKQLTRDPHLDTSPAWSPDGRKVAFVSARTGTMRIWTADLDTGREQMLSTTVSGGMACRDVTW